MCDIIGGDSLLKDAKEPGEGPEAMLNPVIDSSGDQAATEEVVSLDNLNKGDGEDRDIESRKELSDELGDAIGEMKAVADLVGWLPIERWEYALTMSAT